MTHFSIKKKSAKRDYAAPSTWHRTQNFFFKEICCVCLVNVQLSLHLNVIFSLCALMGFAACIIFIIWNSISGLEAWYHFRFNISFGGAVMVRNHPKKIR